MADYTDETWVDDDGSGTVGTALTAARMNNIEEGVKDAAEHNQRGTLGARPAASSANKNHLYFATDDRGGTLYHSDGSSWEATGSPVHSIAGQLAPVRVVAPGAITIATALNNGDSLDGVTLVTGDRVLVPVQSTPSQNGIYVVGTTPVRAADLPAGQVVAAGVTVAVSAGDRHGDSVWTLDATGPVTVGTTTSVWRKAADAKQVELAEVSFGSIDQNRGFVKWMDGSAISLWLAGAQGIGGLVGDHLAAGYGTPVAGGDNEVVIIGENYESTFPKLFGNDGAGDPDLRHDVRFNFGQQAITFPGSNVLSNTVNISHGLGVAPTVVFLTGLLDPGTHASDPYWFYAFSYGSSTFSARIQATGMPGSGAAVTVNWLALSKVDPSA